ncbi:type 2 periplasmic-binding domain-containing protein [Luteipulveratus halotolerans]|uniref:Uncharacterized protein n=1 Tax=Luteipulveratus halotolerans TaxID=1631356 RepID=A0A0L6CDF8_9MICO|nr:hypothetical protein [Luteipulveratus halotolerans]KNX35847.1 hypothetical protein VV01_21395 [Luteipulveratus halotolerans]KNX35897.1 hypothetical protein VV01_21790 [Luteipulveratus halotolerans]KNX35941.1 hypothetical protein VV01_22070 [Luteipulveratus halotolerans]KNX35943.1 hypothetical protein VV01_22095 [Luteipulveratus halotolerans]
MIARFKVSSTVRESTLQPAGTATGGEIPITLRPSTVTEVLAGDLRVGQTINLSRPGKLDESIEGMEDVEPNKEYLLFVEAYPDGRASIIGGDEGIFKPAQAGAAFTSKKFGTVTANTLQSAARKAHP